MAENKGILPSSTFNTLGNNSNKWEAVYANKLVGPLTGNVTGNVSGSSSSCTGNAATATTATNADKLDGYHYDDIINNAKASVSSGVMGAPNWRGAIGVNTSSYTAPSNGFLFFYPLYISSNSRDSYIVFINNIRFDNIILNYHISYGTTSICVPLKKGDNFQVSNGSKHEFFGHFVPCS